MSRPICQECKKRPCEKQYLPARLDAGWKSRCYKCRRPKLGRNADQRRRKNGIYKIAEGKKNELKCARCGFVPEHPCQLDVDHKNGNHLDNRPANREVLCANCHRLKTFLHRDWKKVA